MKKISLIFLFGMFAINVFASPTKWKTTEDVNVYEISWDGINFTKTSKLLPGNTSVTGMDSNLYKNNEITMVNINKYEQYFVDINSLIPADTPSIFDETILKDELKGKKLYLISESYFKALSNKDRDFLLSIEKEGYKDYQKNKGDSDYEWFESRTEFNYSYIYNVVISLRNIFSYYDFMIQKIEKQNNEYFITAEVTYWKDKDGLYKVPEKGEIINVVLDVDGDYVKFSCFGKLLGTYVIVNEQTSKEIDNFIRKNNCDYSKIKWPRHDDGTCNYETKKTTVASSSSATNVNKNKIMTTKENLKLRSGEATSSNVLTIMSTGTKVKILELGKFETIEGINSNWVKVEVISGKDREGKVIKKGTTGWCYGGYLQ